MSGRIAAAVRRFRALRCDGGGRGAFDITCQSPERRQVHAGEQRPRTAWMDNIKTWTGLSVEESVRMTQDRDKWRKYVHGVANPRIEDG